VPPESNVTVFSYYRLAITRAFWEAWDWAVGQGLYLTILLAIGLLIIAVVYSTLQALRRVHSWADVMSDIGHAITDFFTASIVAAVIALLIVFIVFFIKDAPSQVSQANIRIAELENRLKTVAGDKRAALADLQDRKDRELAQARAEINELRLRVGSHAYALGVSFSASRDLTNSDNTVEIRTRISNTNTPPLAWFLRSLSIHLANKVISDANAGPFTLNSGESTTWFPHRGLTMDEYLAANRETNGTLTYDILYGSPNAPYDRRATGSVSFIIFKTENTFNFEWNWIQQKDQEFEQTNGR
jgi:hypothetical protein